MVSLAEIQTAYYMIAATGVLIAAIYYIITLRNANKLRRRDMVLQRLQAPIQFYDAYWSVMMMTDWNTLVEFYQKYGPVTNKDAIIKLNYITNHFNALGTLVEDGIVTPEEIFRLYLPYTIINVYEKFQPILMRNRIRPDGVVHNPGAFKGYELLYNEAKRLYPLMTVPFRSSLEENLEDTRKIQEQLKKNPTPK